MTACQKPLNKKALVKTVRTLLAEASSGQADVDPEQRITRAHAFVDCALIFKVITLPTFDEMKKEIQDHAADHRTIAAQEARTFKRAAK